LSAILIGGGKGLADHAGIAAFASEILVVDPAVGFLKSNAERRRQHRPPKYEED
jgi:hypothetical protein